MTARDADPGAHSGSPLREYDALRLRMDTWTELLQRCLWLKEYAKAGRETADPRALVAVSMKMLQRLEIYWAYPGSDRMEQLSQLFEQGQFAELGTEVSDISRLMVGDAYRRRGGSAREARRSTNTRDLTRGNDRAEQPSKSSLYFEVLFVDGIDAYDRDDLREGFASCRRDSDEFIYEVVTVPSLEDAVIAVLFNPTIQAVFLRYNYTFASNNKTPELQRYLDMLEPDEIPLSFGLDRSVALGRVLKRLRPELDLYLVTDAPLDRVAGNIGSDFRRVFYRLEQYMEQHLSILKGIQSRYQAPFFDALRKYAAKPTGVFHALPIARGKSMTSSHWARDMYEFYGANIFLAETSATSGGLDSLLQPRGPIKKSQDLAARAFGAQRTFFVTNGTSTANKIVLQAIVRPGDIVLIDRDCHKSHHYAMVLAGAMPVYLDSYPLTEYSMYGAVPIEEIERQLLDLKAAGKLHKVRMLLLTNCTFDGITYDPAMVMSRVLAIKPDMIFLWDEAWFAYARFDPTLRRRTAMDSAARLKRHFRSTEYRERFARAAAGSGGESDHAEAEPGPMVDPDRVRIRVYATQSTHKTLTSLRQGSMIHIHDEDFEQLAADSFHEAFMTHTSTSPNYQIIASLDVGRRQVELEGYELVEKCIGLAMTLRERVNEHPDLARFFSVLRPGDMIPRQYRPSGLEFYYDSEHGWGRMEDAWRSDEFTLDPTRVTLQLGVTGMDGDAFRHLLMDQHDIQINKTSRNTALFLSNIGTTRGDVAYLVDVLANIARSVEDRLSVESSQGLSRHVARVDSLLNGPPLPNFSRFHPAFKPDDGPTPEGDLRSAFFLAYDDVHIEWVPLATKTLDQIRSGRELVSAAFVIPYPPGFPILVPGQVMSQEIIAYLLALDVKEIHGYHSTYGLRVFTEAALERAAAARARS